MTVKIILVLFGGILTGMFIFEPDFMLKTDTLLDVGLFFLLFFVGIDIGSNKKAFDHLKRLGFKILLIPISAALGSIFGGILVSGILGMKAFEGGAIGAGFGWYSLSAVLIAPYSSELSTIAFLTNVIREIMAIMFIPLTAKYIGYYETISLGGATSMDTTLPIITKNTNSETAVISFISGLLMSIMVPIIVPIFISLL